MKKILRLLAIAAFVIATTVPAFAFWGNNTMEGSIQRVTGESIILSTKADAPHESPEIMSFKINEETELKDIASLDALEQGQKVRVEYAEKNRDKVATQISRIEQKENKGYLN